MNIDSVDIACGAAGCDMTATTNIALANTLAWSSSTVVPVELSAFSVD